MLVKAHHQQTLLMMHQHAREQHLCKLTNAAADQCSPDMRMIHARVRAWAVLLATALLLLRTDVARANSFPPLKHPTYPTMAGATASLLVPHGRQTAPTALITLAAIYHATHLALT